MAPEDGLAIDGGSTTKAPTSRTPYTSAISHLGPANGTTVGVFGGLAIWWTDFRCANSPLTRREEKTEQSQA